MITTKLSRVALSLVLATTATSLTACKKGGGGGRKGKSERLRWVERPQDGKTEKTDVGTVITVPGIGISFYTPDVLYVYRSCEEPGHAPEGEEREWIPVIRCNYVADGTASSLDEGGGGDEDEWDSEEEDDEGGGASGAVGTTDMTIYAADKRDTIINERSVESFRLQYQNAGYKVVEIGYHDEYLAKPGRRGIEIIAQTIDSETGYPEREIRRFMFPVGDVLFIAHIEYGYGDDKSGIDSDWQRILWGFQLAEDGPLYDAG